MGDHSMHDLLVAIKAHFTRLGMLCEQATKALKVMLSTVPDEEDEQEEVEEVEEVPDVPYKQSHSDRYVMPHYKNPHIKQFKQHRRQRR